MEIYQKNKKVFLFLGIFAAVVILYELFFSGGSTSTTSVKTNPTAGGLVSQVSASSADAIVGQKLLVMLGKLQSINFDTTIFTDPVFLSLKDNTKVIDKEPLGKEVGRRNPFSNFGETGGSH